MLLDDATVMELVGYLDREAEIMRDCRPGLHRDEALERIQLECWYTREIGLLKVKIAGASGDDKIALEREMRSVMDDRIHARALLRTKYLCLQDDDEDMVDRVVVSDYHRPQASLERDAWIRRIGFLVSEIEGCTDEDTVARLTRQLDALKDRGPKGEIIASYP